MADYDSFDYEINKRLPEWYKHSGLATSVNKYTQDLIADLLQGLLSSTGVVQPLNCWLTIPEEYNWFHHYYNTDEYLEGKTTRLFGSNKVNALLPNTKRKCDARIRLKLLGNPDDIPPEVEMKEDWNQDLVVPAIEDINPQDDSVIITNESDISNIIPSYSGKTKIDKLILENGNQRIIFKDIENTSTIEINTKTNEITIDGKHQDNLIEGSFHKIEPTIKYPNYKEPYVYINDEGEEVEGFRDISIQDENKETKITLWCETETDKVEFDLQVRLYKPTYTTEQKIRIATVSAFPIEWVELWGYFCHPFNNKQGYECVWKKQYTLESRTTFDQITKQFDCERFFIKVKFHGIGTPLQKGFPQEELASELMFQPNPHLDKWGKFFGMPRRVYRTDITEDEEPYTFPKYYKYPIEQDYWYEERITNEYRLDDEAINSLYVRDTDYNNLMILECIYPFMNDIWVYTETINPDEAYTKEIKNIGLCDITQDVESAGIEWDNIRLIMSNAESNPINLKPQSDEVLALNDFSFQTKTIHLSFCLEELKAQIPHDVKITGIELEFNANTNANTNLLRLTEDSCMILPYFIDPPQITVDNDGNEEIHHEVVTERIDISGQMPVWSQSENYKIGGENYLFGEEEISRDQLLYGNNGKLDFEIGFINENTFIDAYLLINNIFLNIYYQEIPDEFDIKMSIDKNVLKTAIQPENKIDEEINITFKVTNQSKKKIIDKRVFVIASSEFKILDSETDNEINGFDFSLDEDESFEAKLRLQVNVENQKPGKYDIIAFCDDKIMKEEIMIKSNLEMI